MSRDNVYMILSYPKRLDSTKIDSKRANVAAETPYFGRFAVLEKHSRVWSRGESRKLPVEIGSFPLRGKMRARTAAA
jgi:hypothetical protein